MELKKLRKKKPKAKKISKAAKAKIAADAKAKRVARKTPDGFKAVELKPLVRKIADKMFGILEGMPGLEYSSCVSSAKKWVKDHPGLGISRFAMQMMVGIKNNKTNKVRSFYYQSPMKNCSYVDAYNWAISIVRDKMIEETPAKNLKLLSDGETVASDAFGLDFKLLLCDKSNPELNWWAN